MKFLKAPGFNSVFKILILFHLSALLTLSSQSYAATAGDVAPDLPMQTTPRINLEKYKGNVIYLDFWASWCGTCQLSLPWMNELASKLENSKFKIVTVNLDKNRSSAQELLNNIKPVYPVEFDPEGKLAMLYAVNSMPSSYLIAADGKILSVYSGFGEKHKTNIESDIHKALGIKENENN